MNMKDRKYYLLTNVSGQIRIIICYISFRIRQKPVKINP